jgi:hypothetical protein
MKKTDIDTQTAKIIDGKLILEIPLVSITQVSKEHLNFEILDSNQMGKWISNNTDKIFEKDTNTDNLSYVESIFNGLFTSAYASGETWLKGSQWGNEQ